MPSHESFHGGAPEAPSYQATATHMQSPNLHGVGVPRPRTEQGTYGNHDRSEMIAELVEAPVDMAPPAATETVDDIKAIPKAHYDIYKQIVLDGSSAPEATDITGRHASSEVAAESNNEGRHRAPTQEISGEKRGRIAHLGRAALRFSGLRAAKSYVSREWNSARASIAEDRADIRKAKAAKAGEKVADLQHKEALVMNKEFDYSAHAKKLVNESAGKNNLKSEYASAKAEIAEMRAESKNRKAQRVAAKVLQAQKKQAYHMNHEFDQRQLAKELEHKANN